MLGALRIAARGALPRGFDGAVVLPELLVDATGGGEEGMG